MESFSELRQDIVTGDWVLIATGRAKRPHDFLKKSHPHFRQPKRTCPFEKKSEDAILAIPREGGAQKNVWAVQVITNKYPAVKQGPCPVFNPAGPYQWAEGIGFHEVVIFGDHERSFGMMTQEETEAVVQAYQERYLSLREENCVKYVSIFHNHGDGAGASISHPHSQIVAIPVIPPDIGRSLRGAASYFERNHACVHCAMIRYEEEALTRIIYKNDRFSAFAPYASRAAFEMRIFPRVHSPRFEEMAGDDRRAFAETLRVTMTKLFHGLNNPDYNFFFHSAPSQQEGSFDYYHWHLEIIPKTGIWAGFEIGTGIEISTIAPESAAGFLRSLRADEGKAV
jgi:UDPglucose--hexose-1-phosphate uridylyltransferase